MVVIMSQISIRSNGDLVITKTSLIIAVVITARLIMVQITDTKETTPIITGAVNRCVTSIHASLQQCRLATRAKKDELTAFYNKAARKK